MEYHRLKFQRLSMNRFTRTMEYRRLNLQWLLMNRVARMLAMAFLILGFNIGAESAFVCPDTAIFVFGDSLTDTGNIPYLAPDYLHSPYGQSYYFPGSINPSRFSDGRLIIDFFAQAFGFPFVKPIEAAGQGAGYRYGANFAYGGATAATNLLYSPFSLSSEVQQFLTFRSTSSIPHVDPSYFGKALYVISAIGGNDFLDAFSAGLVPSQVINDTVPLAVNAVRNALETLYASGLRSFFIFNVPPIGCIPYILTLYEGQGAPLDNVGCLREYNEVVEVYNAHLHTSVKEYRLRWSDACILFFDTYQANRFIYSNPEAYGFRKDKALVACCGYGSKYNFSPTVTCSNSGEVQDPVTNVTTFVNISSACEAPAQYLSWDGVHPTQALNRQLALLFLNGRFVEGPTGRSNLSILCNLNFTGF